MTLTIDASIGGPASNSFADEATAITFAATRLNLTGWATVAGSSCTEDEKKALIEATRELSALIYVGYRASLTQSLSWPRYEATNPDAGIGCYGFYLTTVVPQRVIDATCELAIAFLAAGTTDIAAADESLNVIRKNIGGAIETEYAVPSQRAQGLARFPRVLRLVSPLLAIGAGQVRLTR